MKTKVCIYFLLLTSYLLLSTCRPNLKNPTPSSGDADFSKFVALGGNFMAGYQDGALYKDGQQYSIPYLIAKFMHLAGGPAEFAQPFMPDNEGLGFNPKPWESAFQHASKLRYKLDCEGTNALKPIKDLFSTAGIYENHPGGTFQNISVPFARMSQYNDYNLGGISPNPNSNIFYHRFASQWGISTMLSDAKTQSPTFFALWTGMEDIFDYARNGGYNQNILPSDSFSTYLDAILSQFNTKGVIANIPDLTSFPFYTLIPWDGMDLSQGKTDSLNLAYFGSPPYWYLIGPDTFYIDTFHVGKNGFMIEDPASTAPPPGYRKMVSGEYILLTIPLDSMKCNKMGSFIPLPDRYVLDINEVNIINQTITDYNTVIAAMAQKYNLALVDMNAFFKSVVNGIKWNGVDYNAEFVSGGFFSLDGYHPNQKGYALIANEFVKAINSKYNSTIPTVNCPECSGIKFP